MDKEEKGQNEGKKLRWNFSENTTIYTGPLDQPALVWKWDICRHVTIIDLARQLVEPQILQVVDASHQRNLT
jgi:hypothetical protein